MSFVLSQRCKITWTSLYAHMKYVSEHQPTSAYRTLLFSSYGFYLQLHPFVSPMYQHLSNHLKPSQSLEHLTDEETYISRALHVVQGLIPYTALHLSTGTKHQ